MGLGSNDERTMRYARASSRVRGWKRENAQRIKNILGFGLLVFLQGQALGCEELAEEITVVQTVYSDCVSPTGTATTT